MDGIIIGGSGLVGTNLVQYCERQGYDVLGTYHSESTETADTHLDKTERDEVTSLIKAHDPDFVVDTAAFHTVDDCETERAKAFDVNAIGTRNVATAADSVDAHVVYLSTDYVFPGHPEDTPYAESDAVNPCNYYAQTKYAAEQAAKIPAQSTILRPSVVYGLASDNFATWALDELQDGHELDIVDDQVSRPTYAPDLARACIGAVENDMTGLYHATGPASMSRYEFTVTLAEVFGYDVELVSPISTEELGQEAPRPTDSSLDSTSLYQSLGDKFTAPETAFQEMREDVVE